MNVREYKAACPWAAESHLSLDMSLRYDKPRPNDAFDYDVQAQARSLLSIAKSNIEKSATFRETMGQLALLLYPYHRNLPHPYPPFEEFSLFNGFHLLFETSIADPDYMLGILSVLRVLTWSSEICAFLEGQFGILSPLVHLAKTRAFEAIRRDVPGAADRKRTYISDLCSTFVNLAAEPSSRSHHYPEIFDFATRRIFSAQDHRERLTPLHLLENLTRDHPIRNVQAQKKVLEAVAHAVGAYRAVQDPNGEVYETIFCVRGRCASILRLLISTRSLNIEHFHQLRLANFVRENLDDFPVAISDLVSRMIDDCPDMATFYGVTGLRVADFMRNVKSGSEHDGTVLAALCWAISKFFRRDPDLARDDQVLVLLDYVVEMEEIVEYLSKSKLLLVFCSVFRGFPESRMTPDLVGAALDLIDDILLMDFDQWLTVECQFPLRAIKRAIPGDDENARRVAEMAAKLRECLAENGQGEAAQGLAEEFGLDEDQM